MAKPHDAAPSALHRWRERDRSLAQVMHRATARPSVLLLLTAVSWLGNGTVWYATLIALPWTGEGTGMGMGTDTGTGTECALRMALLGGANLAIYGITRRHFARPRPFIACPGVRACARCAGESSFPSGQAMHAVGFAALLSAFDPALGWIVWPFAAVVAASRVVLGLHYPSDVLVGSAIGWSMAQLVLGLF